MIQKEFSTDGFAIWVNGKLSKLNIHINYWIVSNGNNYVDIGIRMCEIDKKNGIEEIYCFIPYRVTEEEIEDLSKKLSNEQIARGVFNSICEINDLEANDVNKPTFRLKYNNEEKRIIKLKHLKCTIENLESTDCTGMKISFSLDDKLKKSLKGKTGYLRFRIPNKTLNNLLSIKKYEIGSLFDSPMIKTQYNYFLKINEVRSLPWKIREDIKKTKIGRVIIIISTGKQYSIEDNECYKVRQLEKELYHDYVPKNFDCNDVVVYQWSMEEKENCNFNIEVIKEEVNYLTLFMYSFIVIGLAISGNILSDYLMNDLNLSYILKTLWKDFIIFIICICVVVVLNRFFKKN